MDPLQIIARIGTDNPPTDDELAQALSEIKSALDVATKADRPDVSLAKDLRAAADAAQAEIAAREIAAEEARAEVAKLREGLLDDSAQPAEEPVEDEPAPVEEPQAVAASASTTADAIKRLRSYAERLPAEKPETPAAPGVTVRPVGPASSFELTGAESLLEVGEIFAKHAKGVSTPGAHIPLVRLDFAYGEDRKLGHNVELNNKRVTQALGYSAQRAIAAAGGLCGPGDVDHSHPICSDRGRPVRDALPQFNAARGKVTVAPSASLGLLAGNVSIWTSETDTTPGSATKPCPPIDCPEEITESVDAVVKCLTVGNFQAQFSPEFWASRLELAMAQHDREAEQKAIAEIHAGSTNLTDVAPAGGNTLANFLQTVNTVISGDRQVHRNLDGAYVVIADAFVRDAIRNQFIQNNGTGNVLEAIQVADSEIDGWLSTLNARVVWTFDGTIDTETGLNRVVTPGTMPTESTLYIHQEGAFLFLDGGTLDLGTSISDSNLNATNDRQAFSETFEKVLFRGCSAYRVEIALANACGCPA